jgi:REP element-mobilizing transposase RayT
MANHIHHLIKPDDASQLPKLMHWVGWYASMLLNRLTGRCGHFWEARYYATPIAPKATKEHSTPCVTFTPIQKQQECVRGFTTPTATTGTTAD